MKGHGEKYTRLRETVIVNLLTEPTYADAARKSGISEVTLYRWMQRPGFARAWRAARRRLVESAISQMQQAATKAVATLVKLLDSKQDATRARAAVEILAGSLRGVELTDLAERLAALEGKVKNEPPQQPAESARQDSAPLGDEAEPPVLRLAGADRTDSPAPGGHAGSRNRAG